MTEGIEPPPLPYSFRKERLRWHFVLAAGALTAVQVIVLILSGNLTLDRPVPPLETVAVTTIPENPAPPPPEPEMRVEPRPEPQGAPPPPAPAMRPMIPDPPVVLTRELVPPLPVTPPVLSRIPGTGAAPSLGDGNGNGVGSGNGDSTGAGTRPESAPPGPRRLLFTRWAPSMDMRRLHDFYPEAAREQRLRGYARLDCEVIERARVRDCRLLRERPQGMGFGAAALQAEGVYRIIVTDQNRDRVYNERIQLNAYFEPPR